MAGRIPKAFIDTILSRIDIIELVESRVPLRKAGQNYSACCPFHNEKTPSFTVSRNKQFYHCFGCGAHGNAIGFLMAYEHLDFLDSIEYLAKQLNLEIPHEQGNQNDFAESKAKYDMLERATRFYQQQLKQSQHSAAAIAYLKARGISGETAKQFRLGLAPAAWQNLDAIVSNRTEQQLLQETGMIISKNARHYDRFRDRIMFPISDRRGRVIAFGGRVFHGEATPKYLNSPETPLFHKRQELYGLFEAQKQAQKQQSMIIVEGYMDVIMLSQAGITNVVATLGTSITAEHLKRLFRYSNDLIFCFDGDRAGREAAWRALNTALPALYDGRQVRFAFLPDGEDPDSLVQAIGVDAFRERLQQADGLDSFLIKHLMAEVDLNQVAGKARFHELVKPLLAALPNGVFKESLSDEISQLVGVSKDRLDALAAPKKSPQDNQATPAKHNNTDNLSPIRLAITLLLQEPSLATEATPYLTDLKSYQRPGMDILLKLIALANTNTKISTGHLLEYFRQEKYADYLYQLASLQLAIPAEGFQAEFIGSLACLAKQALAEQTQALLEKASYNALTPQEKQTLQYLIKQQKASTALDTPD